MKEVILVNSSSDPFLGRRVCEILDDSILIDFLSLTCAYPYENAMDKLESLLYSIDRDTVVVLEHGSVSQISCLCQELSSGVTVISDDEIYGDGSVLSLLELIL